MRMHYNRPLQEFRDFSAWQAVLHLILDQGAGGSAPRRLTLRVAAGCLCSKRTDSTGVFAPHMCSATDPIAASSVRGADTSTIVTWNLNSAGTPPAGWTNGMGSE